MVAMGIIAKGELVGLFFLFSVVLFFLVATMLGCKFGFMGTREVFTLVR
jgi:hypothetical protein